MTDWQASLEALWAATSWIASNLLTIVTAIAALVAAWASVRSVKLQSARKEPTFHCWLKPVSGRPRWYTLRLEMTQNDGIHANLKQLRITKPSGSRLLESEHASQPQLSVNHPQRLEKLIPLEKSVKEFIDPRLYRSQPGGPGVLTCLAFIPRASSGPKSFASIEATFCWSDLMSRKKRRTLIVEHTANTSIQTD